MLSCTGSSDVESSKQDEANQRVKFKELVLAVSGCQ